MTELFRAVSPCGPDCLPAATDRTPLASQVTRVCAAAMIVAAAVLAEVALRILPGNAQRRASGRLLRTSARKLLRVLHVSATQYGPAFPRGSALVVANHVSWLDILVLLATDDVRLVAKSDVATWPIVGRLARQSGTIFINRDQPKSLPATIAEVRDAMTSGHIVAVFAEATTSCGTHRMPYRTAMFQAAIDAQAPVVPLALCYRGQDGLPTPLPAFIGDETLVTSLGRVLRLSAIRLDIHVSASLYPHPGASRRALARAATYAAHPPPTAT